jgi:uncharacterized membrane protein YdbT with pleckstrin-like domain
MRTRSGCGNGGSRPSTPNGASVDVDLGSDEVVRLSARPHGAALVRPLARAILGAAAGGVCIWLGWDVHWIIAAVGAVALGLAALLALATVWEWERTEVLVTSGQVVVEYGLVRRRLATVDLSGGGPFELEQGLVGRMLGYGTLVAGGLEVPFVPVTQRRRRRQP